VTEQRPYTYTVLRYVHDARAGEMLNVGIVLHTGHQLLVTTRHTYSRLKDAFPDLDGEAFRSAMRAVERAIHALAKDLAATTLFSGQGDALSLARKALPADDSALQWSAAGSGLTADPEATLARLFQRLVSGNDENSPRRRVDEEVWRPIRDKLAARDVFVPFQPKVITGALDSITFEHAWKNGVWHVYEPVSLDMVDRDGIMAKTHRWLGHLAAVQDGVCDPLKLHFILGAPQDAALEPAYAKALALFRQASLSPEVLEESEIDDLVARIEGEVRVHEGARRRPAFLG
jgi:hypothetical protein